MLHKGDYLAIDFSFIKYFFKGYVCVIEFDTLSRGCVAFNSTGIRVANDHYRLYCIIERVYVNLHWTMLLVSIASGVAEFYSTPFTSEIEFCWQFS